MRVKLKGFILLFLLLSGGLKLAQAQNSELKLTKYTLDNGLTVILNEDHSRPEVFGAVAVKAGSKYDPADATGMAHYLEHMCFKGTQTMGTTNYAAEKPYLDSITALYDQLKLTKDEKEREKIQKHINTVSVKAAEYAIPNEFDRLVQSIGGKGLNAFTSFEEVVYHNSFPPHQIEKWLDLYSERFINPVFRLFQSELETVYEEKNLGSDDFGSALFELYLKNFFKKHPYGQQTTIGTTEDLKNPSLSRMQQYYNTYFVANNMALIISGDFNTEKIKPVIAEKFGRWKSGKVPAFPEYNEEPFKGREVITKRLTPIKLGVIGYRTVPTSHSDQYVLDVCQYILNNQGQTGLLDQLKLDGKIQEAGAIPFPLHDEGGFVFYFLPKIVGQSLGSAEDLVKQSLEKLKNGDYDSSLLIAAKNNLRKEFYQKLENTEERAYYIVDNYIQDREWSEFMKYPDRIAAVTQEDIKRVASTYFGENYLVLQSKMGFPKKDKIKKPGIEPVKPKDGVKSSYAVAFENIPEIKPEAHFVDFNKDVAYKQLAGGDKLYVTPNPVNDIFSLKIKYPLSRQAMPLIGEAAQFLNYTGTAELPAKEFKRRMDMLGCTYQFSYDDRNMIINISGLEENAEQAIRLVHSLMTNAQPDEEKYKLMLSDIKTNRKLETGDPLTMGYVMNNFLEYGEHSPYLSSKSVSELEEIKPAQLISTITEARALPVSIHYTGKKTAAQVESIFSSAAFSTHKAGNANEQPALRKVYTEPTIYVLNRKDARQSHIYMYASGSPFNIGELATIKGFNSYFGGDMSSLIFQEIREFRSLAYSAYCISGVTNVKPETNYVQGYIGCQGDKTPEAISTMMDLLKHMPEKPERMENIRKGLVAEAYSNRPFFRDISEKIEQWKALGYEKDPNEYLVGQLGDLTFADITKYYVKEIQPLPMSLGIVGNKKNIPIDELKKYGKVVMLDEGDIIKR